MQPHSTWGLRLRTWRRLVLCILWFKGLSEKQPELYKPLTSNEILCLQILKGCKELHQALEKWSAYLKLWSRFLLFFLIYGLAPEPKLHLETFLAVTADCLTLLCSIKPASSLCLPGNSLLHTQTLSYISAGSWGDMEAMSPWSSGGKEGNVLTDCQTADSSPEQCFLFSVEK